MHFHAIPCMLLNLGFGSAGRFFTAAPPSWADPLCCAWWRILLCGAKSATWKHNLATHISDTSVMFPGGSARLSADLVRFDFLRMAHLIASDPKQFSLAFAWTPSRSGQRKFSESANKRKG